MREPSGIGDVASVEDRDVGFGRANFRLDLCFPTDNPTAFALKILVKTAKN